MKRLSLVLVLLILVTSFVAGCEPGDLDEPVYAPDLYPNANNTGNVGGPALQWQNGYFQHVFVNGVPITPGSTINWLGTWVSMNPYVAYDAVAYSGSSYLCTSNVASATTPDIDTAHWGILALEGATGPNNITTATTTNLTGIITGDGSNITLSNLTFLNAGGHPSDLAAMTENYDVMETDTLLDASRSSLSCAGGILTYTLEALSGSGTWNFSGIVYPLAVASASVDLLPGTDISPNTNYVYFELQVGVPTLVAALTEPAGIHIDVAVFIVGAVSGSSYNVYGYGRFRSETESFITRTIDRFEAVGAIYNSGYVPTVTSSTLSIGAAGDFFEGIFKMFSNNVVSAVTGYYFIQGDGSYTYSTSLADLNHYGDPAMTVLGSNERQNIVWGIVPTSITYNGTLPTTVKLFAVLQSKPSNVYINATTAEQDVYETTNYFPPDAELKKVFIPLIRTVVRPSAPSLEVWQSGLYYKDVRGKVTSGGGAATTTDISGLVPYAGASGDVDLGVYGISGGYLYGPTGRYSGYVIAPANAPAIWLAQADVILTGTALAGGDEVPIQAAIDAGQKDILITPGDVYVNIQNRGSPIKCAILTAAELHFHGCGESATSIYLVGNGYADTSSILRTEQSDNVTISDLQIIGDAALAANGDGIDVLNPCNYLTIYNVTSRNCGDENIDLGDQPAGFSGLTAKLNLYGRFENLTSIDCHTGVGFNSNDHSTISNIRCIDTSGIGAYFTGAAFGIDGVRYSTISGLDVAGSGTSAFNFYQNNTGDGSDRECQYLTISNLNARSPAQTAAGEGLRMTGITYSTLTNISIYGSGYRGGYIAATAHDNQLTNCVFSNSANNGLYIAGYNNTVSNGEFVDNAGYGYLISGSAATGNIVTGCRAFDTRSGGSRTQTYGIAELSNADYNIIVGNECYNNITLNLAIVGPNTRRFSTETKIMYLLNVFGTSGSNIHAAIAGNGSLQTITAGISNPDVSRTVRITATNNAAPSGSVIVTGTDQFDRVIVDTIVINPGSNVDGVKPFKTVVSFTIPASVSAADTISLGGAKAFGILSPLLAATDGIYCEQNGVQYTPIWSLSYNTTYIGTVTTNDDFLFIINTPKNRILD